MNHSSDDVQTALNEIVEQIISLQSDAPLPMKLHDWLAWLEQRVDHPMKMAPVRGLDFSWLPFMIQQDHPLLWSASWYARKVDSTPIRKIRASDNFDNDIDYITHTVEFAVTCDTQTSGSGEQAVYVYGFTNDPGFLKVGRAGKASSVRGAFHRIMQQVSTSNRTLPTLHHVIFTDDCIQLEGALHRRLKNEGRWAYDGAGTEWFCVSVDEVMAAYSNVGTAV